MRTWQTGNYAQVAVIISSVVIIQMIYAAWMTESVLKKSGTLLSNQSVARDSLDLRVSLGFDNDLCTRELM